MHPYLKQIVIDPLFAELNSETPDLSKLLSRTKEIRIFLKLAPKESVQIYLDQALLIAATKEGLEKVVAELCLAGANPNTLSPEDAERPNRTPLMNAALCGLLPTVQALIAAKADVNLGSVYYQETALTCAAAKGHSDIVAYLVNAGADPKHAKVLIMDGQLMKYTPWQLAVEGSHSKVVNYLSTIGHFASAPTYKSVDIPELAVKSAL